VNYLFNTWLNWMHSEYDVSFLVDRVQAKVAWLFSGFDHNTSVAKNLLAPGLTSLRDKNSDHHQALHLIPAFEKCLFYFIFRCIAAQLIAGKTVRAETYDCVTIYFSDIEGFIAMSASLTPMQVMKDAETQTASQRIYA